MTLVKICGLMEPGQAHAAATAGADFLGFIFFPKSPRNLPAEQWRALAAGLPADTAKVGVFVNPSDAHLDEIMAAAELDWIQLHGHESLARVTEVKARYGKPVMKALAVRDRADLAEVPGYQAVADRLLFDAKPPDDPSALPGGNGLNFDWRLLEMLELDGIWALAGGLDPQNVRQAVALTHAPMVDVSTGVEIAPGNKDNAKVAAFIGACRTPK